MHPTVISSPSRSRATILVPCGKCSNCRLNLRDQWVTRFNIESRYLNPFFFTLTYSDENVPYNYVDVTTGEIVDSFRQDCLVMNPTARKRDVQLFMKRLRKSSSDTFKYFVVSEYGSRTHRPHYHGIMFTSGHSVNLDPWQLGFTDVQPAGEGSFNYVTKYLLKGSSYVPPGSEEPFRLISSRPAIGSEFEPRSGDDYVSVSGYKKPLPRYYLKRFYSKLSPEQRKCLVEQNIDLLQEKFALNLDLQGYSYDDYIKLVETKQDLIQQRIINDSKL